MFNGSVMGTMCWRSEEKVQQMCKERLIQDLRIMREIKASDLIQLI